LKQYDCIGAGCLHLAMLKGFNSF